MSASSRAVRVLRAAGPGGINPEIARFSIDLRHLMHEKARPVAVSARMSVVCAVMAEASAEDDGTEGEQAAGYCNDNAPGRLPEQRHTPGLTRTAYMRPADDARRTSGCL